MNQDYEIIYLMHRLTFVYPFDILAVLLVPFSVLMLVSYKKSKSISRKLLFIGGLSVVLLPAIFSYIRYHNINEDIKHGRINLVSGKIENIKRFSAQDVVDFPDSSLVISRKSIYCLSNRSLLNVGDDVVIHYYDLNKSKKITKANICIVKVERKRTI